MYINIKCGNFIFAIGNNYQRWYIRPADENKLSGNNGLGGLRLWGVFFHTYTPRDNEGRMIPYDAYDNIDISFTFYEKFYQIRDVLSYEYDEYFQIETSQATLFHLAAYLNRPLAISEFLSDPRTAPCITALDSNGRTAFDVALERGSTKAADVLLQHLKKTGNVVDPKKLHILTIQKGFTAAIENDPSSIQSFCQTQHAASVMITTNLYGKTVLDIALENGSTEAADKLLEYLKQNHYIVALVKLAALATQKSLKKSELKWRGYFVEARHLDYNSSIPSEQKMRVLEGTVKHINKLLPEELRIQYTDFCRSLRDIPPITYFALATDKKTSAHVKQQLSAPQMTANPTALVRESSDKFNQKKIFNNSVIQTLLTTIKTSLCSEKFEGTNSTGIKELIDTLSALTETNINNTLKKIKWIAATRLKGGNVFCLFFRRIHRNNKIHSFYEQLAEINFGDKNLQQNLVNIISFLNDKKNIFIPKETPPTEIIRPGLRNL